MNGRCRHPLAAHAEWLFPTKKAPVLSRRLCCCPLCKYFKLVSGDKSGCAEYFFEQCCQLFPSCSFSPSGSVELLPLVFRLVAVWSASLIPKRARSLKPIPCICVLYNKVLRTATLSSCSPSHPDHFYCGLDNKVYCIARRWWMK